MDDFEDEYADELEAMEDIHGNVLLHNYLLSALLRLLRLSVRKIYSLFIRSVMYFG